MSIALLKKLEELEVGLRDFRIRLRDFPVMLERAETSWRLYQRSREELWTLVGNFHETRGIAAGLGLASKFPDAIKELVKKDVADEKLAGEEAKKQIARLELTKNMVTQAVIDRQRETNVLAGRAEGIMWSAEGNLHEIAGILNRVEASNVEEEDDPDGPGFNSRQADAAPAVVKLDTKKDPKEKALRKRRTNPPKGG